MCSKKWMRLLQFTRKNQRKMEQPSTKLKEEPKEMENLKEATKTS